MFRVFALLLLVASVSLAAPSSKVIEAPLPPDLPPRLKKAIHSTTGKLERVGGYYKINWDKGGIQATIWLLETAETPISPKLLYHPVRVRGFLGRGAADFYLILESIEREK